MVGESWNAFTKRVLVEKHSNIMCENPGGPRPLAAFCRRPCPQLRFNLRY